MTLGDISSYVAEIAPWLYVGSKRSCEGRQWPAVIHIWRHDVPTRTCTRALTMPLPDGASWRYRDAAVPLEMSLDYKDAEHISADALTACADCAAAARVKDIPLLVHCAAGGARSPTVALAILADCERKHPLALLGDIYAPLWRQREIIAHVCPKPLADIVAWYEGRHDPV